MKPAFSVCVYCGSKPGLEPQFAQVAQQVGRWIGQHGGQLVYGGGKAGLMGVVAQATLEAQGRVVGIIPKALMEREMAFTQCQELVLVETMHERKRLMAERSDVFVALPGGIGTLEELFEVWTWRQLGYHDKPIGIMNTAGYFNHLLAFLQTSVTQELLSDWQMNLVQIDESPLTLLPDLVQKAGLTPEPHLQRI
ncbi:MAG: TIGR00730 family Rossman fold protein [Betaproteobacteria bacterium]|nr:TIGR00730 family Rossman fold protein [Betaproteobacteria bacterium]NDD12754.1 TIGR00730 family Rossman fold protein [Betaproteobacteria bacterium]